MTSINNFIKTREYLKENLNIILSLILCEYEQTTIGNLIIIIDLMFKTTGVYLNSNETFKINYYKLNATSLSGENNTIYEFESIDNILLNYNIINVTSLSPIDDVIKSLTNAIEHVNNDLERLKALDKFI